jgi:hypothetical protein
MQRIVRAAWSLTGANLLGEWEGQGCSSTAPEETDRAWLMCRNRATETRHFVRAKLGPIRDQITFYLGPNSKFWAKIKKKYNEINGRGDRI